MSDAPKLPIGKKQKPIGNIPICPKCGSSLVVTERRPDGDNVCVECSHRWMNRK